MFHRLTHFELSEFMETCTDTLKRWTGKTRARVVFDSMVDEFTHDGLFMTILGKPNIAVVGFTTDGDVFGGFYNVAVTEQHKLFYDPTIFAFSFESHGRCMTPQRFVAKEERNEWACVTFRKTCRFGFVSLFADRHSGGGFWLGNERSKSFCRYLSKGFDGLENTTLTGKTMARPEESQFHHCARLVAIQLA